MAWAARKPGADVHELSIAQSLIESVRSELAARGNPRSAIQTPIPNAAADFAVALPKRG